MTLDDQSVWKGKLKQYIGDLYFSERNDRRLLLQLWRLLQDGHDRFLTPRYTFKTAISEKAVVLCRKN